MFENVILALGGLWFASIGVYVLYLRLFRQARLRKKTIARIRRFMNSHSHPYEATAYLMESPKNAERLNQATADIEAGKTIQHGLIDE